MISPALAPALLASYHYLDQREALSVWMYEEGFISVGEVKRALHSGRIDRTDLARRVHLKWADWADRTDQLLICGGLQVLTRLDRMEAAEIA